ncbi:MAG: LysR family transcriptional regulator [Chloroflexota bacterium]|nr:LysR family transcriptional regulator [Chloroflexota bacterium]
MQFHQLRYFLLAVRMGSISGAAQALRLSQPNVSDQIGKLERELGGSLFRRTGRGLVLTPLGARFLPYVERGLSELDAGWSEARSTTRDRSPLLRLGVVPSILALLLPLLQQELRRTEPHVTFITVEDRTVAGHEAKLVSGDIDVAIKRMPARYHGLASMPLLRDRMVLLLSRDHPLASRQNVGLDELQHEPFVALQPGWDLREHLVELCRAKGFEPRVVADTASFVVLCDMALSGAGVTVVPRMSLLRNAETWPVIEEADAVRELGAIWRPASHLPYGLEAFFDTLARLKRQPTALLPWIAASGERIAPVR